MPPGFVERAEKGVVILGLLKDRQPCHRAIKHVEDITSRANTFGTGHAVFSMPDRRRKES